MKERPILMNAPMVRATLRELDPKTNTRRLLSVQQQKLIADLVGDDLAHASFSFGKGHSGRGWYVADHEYPDEGSIFLGRCPFGEPSDRLWVRETWQHLNNTGQTASAFESWQKSPEHCFYLADESDPSNKPFSGRWRPSIHMPRWASRITLEVESVRVERLQDITDADAEAEGIRSWAESDDGMQMLHGLGIAVPDRPRFLFELLWRDINGPESWDLNPYIWAITFKRLPQKATQP